MDNPLDTSPQQVARIAAKAQDLWIADGKPACGADSYREQAADLIGMERNPDAGQIPVDPPVPVGPDGQPIEDARLEDNLGNPGGSLNERDDKRETPFPTWQQAEKDLES
ncbi:hypothetical protein AA103196_0046 [Ameyamaea chiangmaiensis NBRC 103196]|uniref:DUF2934 domain-containing protein n=1 Tax=Ameyamaea chiangmaiensis TaxID=442969 RepID=A0A850PG01_9PROT|nr:hypothetical protein [Ameyamaea chiangmaiensis]MBS4075996.1 hypothetical protein [Ameyamaea chiangmaiensis]NVN40822.1 hypothetical protein [Ameyamaea chiangmaiensis]GBQ61510.1 hypothetical protein AA103196_0046 [Ameyamaea chiangmaiensis NBRC 103196]